MADPRKQHRLVKWVLIYVKGTLAYGQFYTTEKSEHKSLTDFVDANYAADCDRRRSLSGLAFTFLGNTINLKSFLQFVVALSTIESKYMELTEASKKQFGLEN